MMLATIVLLVGLQAALAYGPRVEACKLSTPHAAAVRSVEKWMNRLLEDAVRVSPTFDRLATTIEQYRAIVYVEPRTVLEGGLVGAVPRSVLRAPDGTRYVRVWVLQGRSPDEMIETIGHELQHAIEILDIEMNTNTAKELSGATRNRDPISGVWMIETDAARQPSEAIHRELLVRTQPRRR
jgi:hypothetical protein